MKLNENIKEKEVMKQIRSSIKIGKDISIYFSSTQIHI
jgi:hypothetical protein